MTAVEDALRPLVVPARHRGPDRSGNGGYTAGLLAARLGAPGAIRVTLRQPPPLDAPMLLSQHAGGLRAAFGGAVVAEAEPATLDVDPIEPVSWPAAREAEASYAGWRDHPFPSCFVCGTARSAPDALALRPGPIPDRVGTTAAAWEPGETWDRGDGAVPAQVVWAALDCPGGWTLDIAGRPAVLGRMTASVDALPVVGDRCVVMARLLGRERRKAFTGTTLYDGDGRVLARAHAVWIELQAPHP